MPCIQVTVGKAPPKPLPEIPTEWVIGGVIAAAVALGTYYFYTEEERRRMLLSARR